jgi:hypothetical protein
MIGNDVEGIGSGLISDTIPPFARNNEENNRNLVQFLNPIHSL